MFGGKSKDYGAHDTVIGESTRIVGNLSFRGTLMVDGIIEGDVSLMKGSDAPSQLIIGVKGSIRGKITADNVSLAGTVIGDIHAKQSLELKSTATIEGDVYYKDLAMDMGTQFSGKLEPRYAKGLDSIERTSDIAREEQPQQKSTSESESTKSSKSNKQQVDKE